MASALFEGLSVETVEPLLLAARRFEMEEGAILYEDTEITHAINIVAEGEVGFLMRTSATVDYTEIARVGPGEFFGEGAAIDDLVDAQSSTGRFIERTPRSARIICRRKATIFQLPPTEFQQLLEAHPLVICRNLLRSSARKLRMGVQRTFDEALDREKRQILHRIAGWLTRRVENQVTALRLRSESRKASSESEESIARISAELTETLQILARLANAPSPRISWETFSLRDWWNATEPTLLEKLEARGVALESYLEDLPVESSQPLLAFAVTNLLCGVADLRPRSGRIDFKAGRRHGEVEFFVEASLPNLSEFASRRLFEPFVASQGNDNACVSLFLAKETARRLGGDAGLKRRNGDTITLTLTIPTRTQNAPV